jgi:hypothetical protein
MRNDSRGPLRMPISSSRQFVEQRLCLFEVGGVEAFGENGPFLVASNAVGLELAVGGDRDAGPGFWRQIAGAVGQPPLARAHRRQNQSRNARCSLRLRRAIARYRASNAANEQHHPGPGDHH